MVVGDDFRVPFQLLVGFSVACVDSEDVSLNVLQLGFGCCNDYAVFVYVFQYFWAYLLVSSSEEDALSPDR